MEKGAKRTCDRCGDSGSRSRLRDPGEGAPWGYDALYPTLCVACVRALEKHYEEMSYRDPPDKPDPPDEPDQDEYDPYRWT